MESNLKKLLIIDDDKIVSQIVKERFETHGYTVESILNPLEAMDTIKKNSPHIILLDVVMPEVSGFDLLVDIRKEFNPSELPIIMMTAKSGDEEIVKALELGANDYLVKPFNEKVGVARVELQLKALKAMESLVELHEFHTRSEMITTYSHELNNPLAIAMGYLERDFEKIEPRHIDRVKDSLNRISEILKKIGTLNEQVKINKKSYVGTQNMIDLDD
jgi:two-component system sensor histidine kinase ChiS